MLAKSRAAPARAPRADCQQAALAAAFGADFHSRICFPLAIRLDLLLLRQLEAAVAGGLIEVALEVVAEQVVVKLPSLSPGSQLVQRPELADSVAAEPAQEVAKL